MRERTMRYVVVMLVAMLSVMAGVAVGGERADAAYGVVYDTEEMVVTLPHDEDRLYLTVLGDPRDSRFIAVQSWFDTNAGLRELRDGTHYNVLRADSVMYRARYAQTTDALPCVRLQSADGVILYEAAGSTVPMSPDALAKAINATCFRHRRKCGPDGCPAPSPVLPPDPVPQPLDVTPAVKPTPAESMPAGVSVGIVVLSAAAGAGLGLRRGYKQNYSPK